MVFSFFFFQTPRPVNGRRNAQRQARFQQRQFRWPVDVNQRRRALKWFRIVKENSFRRAGILLHSALVVPMGGQLRESDERFQSFILLPKYTPEGARDASFVFSCPSRPAHFPAVASSHAARARSVTGEPQRPGATNRHGWRCLQLICRGNNRTDPSRPDPDDRECGSSNPHLQAATQKFRLSAFSSRIAQPRCALTVQDVRECVGPPKPRRFARTCS